MSLIEHDQTQRKQALDAGKSFIVQAPAGSGKTTLLIQRFLTLLTHVKAPEEILAITFTKKAANEMRVRVINALMQAHYEAEPESNHAKQTWKLAKEVLQRDQRHQWNLLNNPNQLRIQTIDSLCAYLTKQLPLLSHFGSQPDISDTPLLLYQEAVQEVLTHIEENLPWSASIAKLLLHLDNDLNKLHDLLVSLLSKRDQWLPYIHLESNDAAIKQQLEKNLESVISEHLKSLKNLFPKQCISELCSIIRFAADNLAINKPESSILTCRNIVTLPGTEAKDCAAWLGITDLLLKEDDDWRKQFNVSIGFPAPSSSKNSHEKSLFAEFKQRAVELMIKLNEHGDLRVALADLSYLPHPRYQGMQWDILQALLQVLKITAAQLRVVFQQHGQIDFIENTQATITALGDEDSPTNLALSLDYQIRHILVDEFQDTSFTQYQLIEKLTRGWEPHDGRTLFVVGDPMQSIYRFREAEVGLFLRMRKHGIGCLKLIPLTLAINFRSSTEIVEWNNHHFQNIFPAENNIATGSVTYNSSVSNRAESDSTITVTGFQDANESSQANKIISIITESKKDNSNEKIAILVRARQHLKNIIPALKKASIPYRAVEIDPLAEKQIIQDLLALTSAMLHPANRIAWLAVLRAPWCGLTLADLLIIAGDNPYTTIYEQLEDDDILKNISDDGRNRLARVQPLLKSKIAERDRHDIRSWIEGTWLALGGPACLRDITEMDDINAFFQLLDEFNQHNAPLNLKILQIKIEKLFAAPQHDDTAVQVMTIHSAKGLEFDTVILPHLERKSATDSNPLMLWMEYPLENDQIALLLAPIHATGNDKDSIYNYIYRQQQIKSGYETDRLLYVAATRAKQHLHLLFSTYKRENGSFSIESGSLLKKLWPFFERQAEEIITATANDTTTLLDTPARHLSRVSSDWANPIILTSSTKIISHVKTGGFQLGDARPKIIGTVTHLILQHMANLGIIWWSDQNLHEQSRHLKHQLTQLGLQQEHLASSISFIQNTLNNVLQDPRGRWILQKHQDAQSEFALTAVINDEIMNLVIDRTFIDVSGTRWIIDYKTSILHEDDLESFLNKEQEKYKVKMLQYAQAMRLIEDQSIRLGLYFPALPAWKEWEVSFPRKNLDKGVRQD